ncbi:MAG: CARDB domain-containing protein, partial [Candidatus Altiarchaeota archaeon]|nr:CARDB domain-containing protein [Candidatus Altiarchaeota archaeon]
MMDFKKTILPTTLILLLITQASALNTSLEVQNLTSSLLENASLLVETPEKTDLTFQKTDNTISFNDLSLYDYIDEIDGVKNKILSWPSPGNETTYLRIPADAVISDTALQLSFSRDFGEHTIILESYDYKKCWGCGEKHCSDSDTKSYKAGEGIYHYNIASSCEGSGDYNVNGRNAYDRSLEFTTESLSFESSCSGWNPCHGCPYHGGASCHIKGTSTIKYRRLPASNLTLDVGDDSVIEWNMTGEFNNHQLITNLITQLNTFLTSCTPDNQGYCTIPLTFHSDTTGQVNLSGIKIGYSTEKELLYDDLSDHIHDKDCAAGSEHYCGHGKAICRKTWVRSFDEPSFFYLDVSASATPYRPYIKAICTKPDGSKETKKTNTNVRIRRLFESCMKMKIVVESSVEIRECREGEHDCRTCDLDVYGNVYYSKPKEYMFFGSELVAGVENNVSATIRNSGPATGSFIASLLVDGIPQKYKIINLTEGEFRNITFDYTPQAGQHNITITANTLSDGVTVQELFNGNNIITRLVTVEGSGAESEPTDSTAPFEDVLLSVAGQRTLTVGCNVDRQCWDGFYETTDECVNGVCTHSCEGGCFPGFDYAGEYNLNPTNLEEGDNVPITTIVYNNGDLDANNFLVTLEDNGRIIDYRMISLEDGESRDIEFSWTATLGEHVLSAHIDPLPEPDGVIPEVDEDNNVVSAVFDVKSPSSLSTTDFSGLVAYWRLDEGSGNSVKDYSGNGNHGHVHGAYWSVGVSESALEFNGSDYVDCGTDEGLRIRKS